MEGMRQGGLRDLVHEARRKARKKTKLSTHIVYENIEVDVVCSSVYFTTMLKM